MSETEQDKTEEPTDYKLRKAREEGQVAKGQDLGFFGVLVSFAIFWIVGGSVFLSQISKTTQGVYSQFISNAENPSSALNAINFVYGPTVTMLALLGLTLIVVTAFLQILQLRGLIFTVKPLKPDLSKINPAKGLKRIFSMKNLKEAGKNILKMIIYCVASFLVVRHSFNKFSTTFSDAWSVVEAMTSSALLMILTYCVLALFFTALDQIITRNEFRKQMRMSKSEVKREYKDREGEPRQKQKRKQLHAEYIKQTSGLANLPGSDLIVVNPEHFAVALKYDAQNMSAPHITACGRNLLALEIKKRATELAIPIYRRPKLARKLFRHSRLSETVSEDLYSDVADLYREHYDKRE